MLLEPYNNPWYYLLAFEWRLAVAAVSYGRPICVVSIVRHVYNSHTRIGGLFIPSLADGDLPLSASPLASSWLLQQPGHWPVSWLPSLSSQPQPGRSILESIVSPRHPV